MRISWQDYFIEILNAAALRASCDRGKSGAILVKDNRLLSMGYVGAPAGIPSCDEVGHEMVTRYEELDHLHMNRLPLQAKDFSHHCCLHEDTEVKLLSGEDIKIKDLINYSKDIWIYSVDTDTGKIIPSLAINPVFNGIKNNLLEITLNNNTSFKCTKDHLILMRDLIYKEAKDLNVYDSIMPLYVSNNHGYEQICNTVINIEGFKNWKSRYKGSQKSILTHHLVHDHFLKKPKNKHHRHHIDGNRLNNNPDNLTTIHIGDHTRETINNNIDRHRLNGKILMNNLWNNNEWREKQHIKSIEKGKRTALLTNKDPKAIRSRTIGKILNKLNLFITLYPNVSSKNYNELRTKHYSVRRKRGTCKHIIFYTEDMMLKYFNTLDDAFIAAKTYNHKIIKITELNESYPVYDLEVPEHHNFAIKTGDNSYCFVHNCRTIHAEVNAIVNCARNGISTVGSTMYCTMTPCVNCAMMIIQAGIIKVIAKNRYQKDQKTRELFKQANIELIVLNENLLY